MAEAKDFPVDRDLVHTLAALLQETGLTEIEYAIGDRRIRVVRGAPGGVPVSLAVASTPLAPAAVSPTATREIAGTVKAPMVGTVYLQPQPDAAPFIKVGDNVREGQTLLIIEAMKVMNQIPSPRGGRVAQILVADGAPVEYGQALVVLE
ncbi:MAG TPA: acetyl-CoA carboxylase biotin carboxyl carrier protein subunit [Stellaceae bacterium]|nr:acetyl-CoA carboxylase biotin carboxyl carrier protein subunit [Stellaceae bacterium]